MTSIVRIPSEAKLQVVRDKLLFLKAYDIKAAEGRITKDVAEDLSELSQKHLQATTQAVAAGDAGGEDSSSTLDKQLNDKIGLVYRQLQDMLIEAKETVSRILSNSAISR